MCGLTGFWDLKHTIDVSSYAEIAKAMAMQIKDRGPDSEGVWCDDKAGLAFGHRRLAIVDLSPAGHQPMLSHSQRSVISYNGEIFNTAELRNELIAQGHSFRGLSDTEVILEACEAWGIEEAVKRFIGMFVFAIWDRQEKVLSLVRDRMGIKPLYWGFHQSVLLFGSQLKSFKPHPAWQPEINLEAASAFLRYSYVPAPLSIFKDIHKLQPGSILKIDASGAYKITPFWDMAQVAQKGQSDQTSKSEAELVDELDVLLRDAVKRRMVADVPLGAFLSGGIDSSTVVAMMQAQSNRPIQSFSIGFHDKEYNEAPYAKAVAQHLGTEHHELYLTPPDIYDIIPTIPEWCDEPFADSSQIPTYLVSKLARSQVTVSLSGDGGDELFAGYTRYLMGPKVAKILELTPEWVLKKTGQAIHMLSPQTWDFLAKPLPRSMRPRHIGDKAYKLASIFSKPDHYYRCLVSSWTDPTQMIPQVNEPEIGPWHHPEVETFTDRVAQMQFMDTISYLPDDILTKVDRASMAVSLEARVPLLDHRVVEFAWSLPMSMKIRKGKGKWILRQVLDRYVPNHLIERPKMGFGLPIGDWLRGPLREWAENLLAESRLRNEGLLSSSPIRTQWQEHLSGHRDWKISLWSILMLQAWREHWGV
jgi:asparagine synthase (glutamine-hydrolysing)